MFQLPYAHDDVSFANFGTNGRPARPRVRVGLAQYGSPGTVPLETLEISLQQTHKIHEWAVIERRPADFVIDSLSINGVVGVLSRTRVFKYPSKWLLLISGYLFI